MLVGWTVNTVAIFVTAEILSGFKVKGWVGALVVAAILGVLHHFLGGLLFTVIGIGTLGLGFALRFITNVVVMTLLLMLTDKLSKQLKIDGPGHAVAGAVVMMIVAGLLRRGVALLS